MDGYIDKYGQPKVDIIVNNLLTEAIIDTGFDGDICLPLQLAVQLGLKLRDIAVFELADGSRRKELIFVGSAKFGEDIKDVRIILTESEETLIGTNMFSKLEIDFASGKVVIE